MAANILLKNKLLKKYVSETEKSKNTYLIIDLNIKYFKSLLIYLKRRKTDSKFCVFKKNNILISSNTHSKKLSEVTLGPKSS